MTRPFLDGSVRRRLAGVDGLRLRFRTLFFAQFVAFSGFAVFRNVYLEEMGMTGAQMGTIGFLMTFVGVLAQPAWGLVSDYLGAERPVLLVGALASAVGLLAYPVGDGLATPFLLVAAGTAVYSAFRAPIVPVATGMVLSRGYEYGNIRAFGSIAFGIGSLGFGFLVAALGTVSVVYFYVVGMAVLAAVVWTIPERGENTGGDDGTATESATTDSTAAESTAADSSVGSDDARAADDRVGAAAADPGRDGAETDDGDGRRADDGDGGNDTTDEEAVPDGGDRETGGTDDDPAVTTAARRLVANPEFLAVLAVAFVLGMSVQGGSAFFSVFMRAVGASATVGPWTLSPDALTGAAWTLKTVFEAVAFLYAARFGASYRVLLVVGGVAVTVPNLVYWLSGAPLAIGLAQVPGGIGYGLYYLGAVNLVHEVADEAVTATAQTVLTGAGLGLGGAVGQVVAGRLYDLVGIQEMYLYVALLGFLGAAVALLVRGDGRLTAGGAAA